MDYIERFHRAKHIMCLNYPSYYDKIITTKQVGGNLPKKVSMTIDKKIYDFVYERDNGIDFYMLYDENDDKRCVMIIIDGKKHVAIIENLNGDYSSCPNGSKLMMATMTFLKHNKNKLDINKVVLSDTSLKNCFGYTIRFGDMYLLLNGKTWYMSFGFLPYDSASDDKDRESLSIAVKNNVILNKTLVKDVINLKKYVSEFAPKDFDIKKIDEMKNEKLSLYLKWMLQDYDKGTCKLFYNIYRKIMIDLNIQSLYKQSFYKKL